MIYVFLFTIIIIYYLNFIFIRIDNTKNNTDNIIRIKTSSLKKLSIMLNLEQEEKEKP